MLCNLVAWQLFHCGYWLPITWLSLENYAVLHCVGIFLEIVFGSSVFHTISWYFPVNVSQTIRRRTLWMGTSHTELTLYAIQNLSKPCLTFLYHLTSSGLFLSLPVPLQQKTTGNWGLELHGLSSLMLSKLYPVWLCLHCSLKARLGRKWDSFLIFI